MEAGARQFGVGIFWTYLLAALSFEAVSGAVGARAAQVLRIIGPEYLLLVFFVDFNKDPFGGDSARIAYYAPFLAITIAGPLLRLGALAKPQMYPRKAELPLCKSQVHLSGVTQSAVCRGIRTALGNGAIVIG